MIYSFQFTIPANTAQAAPVQQVLPICAGVIHRVEIFLPPGCMGLVGVCVLRAIHQLWPTNTGDYFIGDDALYAFREEYRMSIEPLFLTAQGYNTDDTYDHTAIIRLGILPASSVAPWLQGYDQRLAAFLGIDG